jgi:hypothetical protein
MATAKHPKNRLTTQRIRELKSPGLYADGNGLYLRVESSGSKRFIQRITVKGGKRHAPGTGERGRDQPAGCSRDGAHQ